MSDKDVTEIVKLFDDKFEKMRQTTNRTLISFGVIVLIFVFGAGGLYQKVNSFSDKLDSMEEVKSEITKLKISLANNGVKIDE